MKFKKWMKVVDPICDVSIWTQYNNDTPAFEGGLLDVPWYFLDYEIGRADNNSDEPIFISTYIDKHGRRMPIIVISLIAK